MNTLSRRFMLAATLAAIAGIGLGILMGITGNYKLAPVHAHLILLGFISMAMFGLFYQCVPTAAVGPLPRMHFLLFSLGTNILVPSLASLLLGYPSVLPLVVLAGCLSIAGIACFGVVVVRTRQSETIRVMATAKPEPFLSLETGRI